jgi:hypothetical protein
MNSRHNFEATPNALASDYINNGSVSPNKNDDLKYDQNVGDEVMSRPIETAATDSKSLTSGTQNSGIRKVGKSLGRRKRKNINIRRLTKRGSKLKKSAKSLIQNEDNCIHEKVEEENPSIRPIPVQKHASQKLPVVSSGDNTGMRGKHLSLQKPVNELIMLQKNVYEGRPATVFFQYPEYCGYERDESKTIHYTQEAFKRQGLSLAFKVTGSTHVYNSVVNSMKNAGFSMISG